MLRSIGAVLAGMIVWSVLWFSSNAALTWAYPTIKVAGIPLLHVPMLLALIVASVVASVAAGYATGWVAASKPVRHALGLGVVQLAIGIYVEITYWSLLPVWYHLLFLVLLVPGNVFGGWLRGVSDSR